MKCISDDVVQLRLKPERSDFGASVYYQRLGYLTSSTIWYMYTAGKLKIFEQYYSVTYEGCHLVSRRSKNVDYVVLGNC